MSDYGGLCIIDSISCVGRNYSSPQYMYGNSLAILDLFPDLT
jgi:hypothetical protein